MKINVTKLYTELYTKLIRLVILSSFCMIFLSFWLEIGQVTIFLFINIAASILAYIVSFKNRNRAYYGGLLFIAAALAHYLIFMDTLKLVDSLILISIVCFGITVAEYQLDSISKKILLIGSVVCAVTFLLNVTVVDYYTEQEWLVFVYENSNTTAMIILVMLACVLLVGMKLEKIIWKIASGILATLLVGLVWLTSSRASFVAALLMVVAFVVKLKFSIPPIIYKIFYLFPFIIIPIMINVAPDYVSSESEYLGKTLLSGREILWQDAVEIVWSNFTHLENEFTSGLNVVLRLPYLCGLIGLVLFFYLFYKMTMKLNTLTVAEKNTNCALLVFCCFFVQQGFESILVSGSYSIAYLVMALLGLATSWKEEA